MAWDGTLETVTHTESKSFREDVLLWQMLKTSEDQLEDQMPVGLAVRGGETVLELLGRTLARNATQGYSPEKRKRERR